MVYKIILFLILPAVLVIGFMKGSSMIDSGVSSILCAILGGAFSYCLSNLKEK